MTVIPLHPKHNVAKRNPVDTLGYVLDAISSGDTNAESIVVAWNEPSNDGRYHMRYMIGGETTLAGTLGMLDIVKGELLK